MMLPTMLDRNSPLPLYFQLKQILLENIKSGAWKPGRLIPGEHDLEDQYQVSRTVVRQTLSELVNEGWLERHRGRGTFIAQRSIVHDPARRLDLNEFMEQQGFKLGWTLVDWEKVMPSDHVRQELQLKPQEMVMRLRRLRLADGNILGSHTSYLPMDIAPHADEKLFCVGESINYLFSYPNLNSSRIMRTMEAHLADIDDLKFMPIQPNSPILQVERLISQEDGKPIEYLVGRFRGDLFKFRMTI